MRGFPPQTPPFGELLIHIDRHLATAAPLEYLGTRGDVRMLCQNEGTFLLEGGNFSQCFTPTTDVLCRDDGTCSSPNFDLARAEGYQADKAAS